MKTNMFKQEVETQTSDDSDYCPADRTDSSSKKMQKMKNTKKSILEEKENGVSTSKNLKSPKSKDKEASANPKKPRSGGRKRTRYNDLYDDVEARFSVLERADRVLTDLGTELPHFLKCMLPSNVTHGFWLHLPKNFCSVNLPNHDTFILLEDEWGNEYQTTYFLDRHGLSAGWRGFAISHRLLKGDILIFHLTAPCRLKVHIVRITPADVVDAALCLMSMNASNRGSNADPVKKVGRKRTKIKYVEPYHFGAASPLANVKGRNSILSPEEDCSSNTFFSDVTERRPEIPNQHELNELCYSETPSLHDHAREGVKCG